MSWLQITWQQKTKELYAVFAESFQVLTITILSILLPLSFLLLARLSSYSHLLSIAADPTQPHSSFIFSLFLYSNTVILYFLISFVSISTLLQGLTGRITILSESAGELYRPRLYTAWILLCTLHVFVGLGIEGSIAAEIDGYSFDNERSLFSRVIFFLGLHETMLCWCRTVVKPVVDDTIFGAAREERWVQMLALAASFGTLWWWRLRDEVESLVIVAESRKEISVAIGMADLLGWWLYYLTVTIGMVRIVKGVMWVSMALLCRTAKENYHQHHCPNEDNV